MTQPATDHEIAVLLQEITHCPVILAHFADTAHGHPCAAIINAQPTTRLEEHQVPEPWSGALGSAKLLFLSSNPAIGDNEDYPLGNWPTLLIDDFFTHRFGGGQKAWTADGIRPLLANDSYGNWVHFWAGVRARAVELLKEDASPGDDYVLSEVVHCKSSGEAGVREAQTHCADRYLARLVSCSAARVVVCLGTIAAAAARRIFALPEDQLVTAPVNVANRDRVFAFLPHPNAHQPKTFALCVGDEQTAELSRILSGCAYEGDDRQGV